MNRNDVLKLQEEMEYCQKQMLLAEKTHKQCIEAFDKSRVEYRIAEVEYVLDAVLMRDRCGKLKNNDIQTYLTHCINCLRGNIDGTVLDMEIREDGHE